MQEDSGDLRPLDVTNAFDQESARRNPNFVFSVGEKLEVKGGNFRVKSIGKKMMVLEGLPGTRLKTEKSA